MEKYGAGIAYMSSESGIAADKVKEAVERRKQKYPKLYEYDDIVFDQVQDTRQVTKMRTDAGYQRAVGFYRGPTCTLFHFLEGESSDWQQDKGIMTSFSPTCIKNYPSQGLGGEITLVQAGRLFRALLNRDLRDVIKLCNTVHDSIYVDMLNEATATKYLPYIAGLLEDVSTYFSILYAEVAWDCPFPIDAEYGDNMLETHNKIKERNKGWV